MGRRLTPDQRAARLASRQHGAITMAQALAAGLTEDQVRWRLRTRRWRLAARGTFVVAGAPETWQQAVMVACLAGPAGTVASHLTAAALFGLWKPPTPPHVTVPRHASGRLVEYVYKSDLEPGATRLQRWLAPRLGPRVAA